MKRVVDIIDKKKQGLELSRQEIEQIVVGITNGTIPDYQLSAWLMAVYFQGMTKEELSDLVYFMVESGEKINLSTINKVIVDKHSTGGVGDKATLIVAPIVAACGLPVAKMSGRGLGHTGGTIDKLNAIPGYLAEVNISDFIEQVKKHGIAIVGQSGNLVPADKKMYAMRDVTATVNSIPLIASSVMSKKIAAGADAIVLDVKVGKGAFLESLADAKKLAHSMVKIGKALDKRTVALLTLMDQPLGRAVGNSLEVIESIEFLQGKAEKELELVVKALARQMLLCGKVVADLHSADRLINEVINNGAALQKFKSFLLAQGVTSQTLKDIEKSMGYTQEKTCVYANKSGYIVRLNALDIGRASMMTGAGRQTVDDIIDYQAGIWLHKKIGDYVDLGDKLATIHHNIDISNTDIKKIVLDAYEIGGILDNSIVKDRKIVIDTIDSDVINI